MNADNENIEWLDALDRLAAKAASQKAAAALMLDEAADILHSIMEIYVVFREHNGELRGQIPRRLRDALAYERKFPREPNPAARDHLRDRQNPVVGPLKHQERSCLNPLETTVSGEHIVCRRRHIFLKR